MSDRDPKWRDQILDLDGYHCQITGFDGREEQARAGLEAHHHKRRGMGGSPSRDSLANGITLTVQVHRWEHDGQITILQWDREAGVLEVEDLAGVILDEPGMIPRERLWFYASRLRGELESEEELITNLVGSDREIARMCWHRWTNDNFKLLDPDARSFRAYTEARSWPTDRFENLAKLFELARTCEVAWGEGESARAYRHRLRAAGKVSDEREFWHLELVTPLAELVDSGAVIVRKDKNSVFGARLPEGVKVGKLHGLESKDGGLTDRKGRQIRMIPFAENLTESDEIPRVKVSQS